MFFAEAQIRVHLYGQPTDMRKSYDGLQALARHAMGRDPLDGALYIFVNWRAVRTREMDWTGLKLLLEGLEGKRIRKRFSLPSVVRKDL